MAAGQGCSDRGSWKSDPGCILEIELLEFPYGLDGGCKIKRGVKHPIKVYGMCSWEEEAVRS